MKKCSRGKFWISVGLVLLMLFTIASMSLFAMETALLEEDELVAVIDAGDASVMSVSPQTATGMVPIGFAATGNYNWEYGSGNKTYLSKSGNRPCSRCHSGGSIECSHQNNSCDCLVINGAIQCCAYAHVVFKHLTGFYWNANTTAVDKYNYYEDREEYTGFSLGSVADFEDNVTCFKCPIFLQVKSRLTGGWHYLCIIEKDDTTQQLVFCDANGESYNNPPKNCHVRNEVSMSYTDFLGAYSEVRVRVSPTNCPDSYKVLYRNRNYHWYGCSDCNSVGTYTTHNFVGSSCSVCEQANTHTQLEWRADMNYHWKVCVGCCSELQVTNREQHNYGLGGVRCACGALNASINKSPEIPEMN